MRTRNSELEIAGCHCRPILRAFLLAAFGFAVGMAQDSGQPPQAAESSGNVAAERPPIPVYVSDFELDAQTITQQGLLGAQQSEATRRRVLRRRDEDPQAKARKLVDLMSTSLVADLTKAGFAAQRLLLASARPASGLWIHGIFTELNEGNQITRAVIGFGLGGVKMSLYVTVTNLAHPGQPLYSSADNGQSGKKPGAVITMSPIGAAVKFVMEKNAT